MHVAMVLQLTQFNYFEYFVNKLYKYFNENPAPTTNPIIKIVYVKDI
jgi:hypothetical protein